MAKDGAAGRPLPANQRLACKEGALGPAEAGTSASLIELRGYAAERYGLGLAPDRSGPAGGAPPELCRTAQRRADLAAAQRMACDLDRLLSQMVAQEETTAHAVASPVPTVAPPLGAPGLTRRQQQVASLLASDMTDREIAATLGISVNTARRYSADVLSKLSMHSRREVRRLAQASSRM